MQPQLKPSLSLIPQVLWVMNGTPELSLFEVGAWALCPCISQSLAEGTSSVWGPSNPTDVEVAPDCAGGSWGLIAANTQQSGASIR